MTKILVLHSSTSCGIIHPHHRFIMAVICPVGTFLISGLLMPSTSVDLLQACSNFIFCKFAVSFTMLDVWIFSICQVYYIPSFQPVKINTFYVPNIWVYLFCIVQAEVATNNVADSSLFVLILSFLRKLVDLGLSCILIVSWVLHRRPLP